MKYFIPLLIYLVFIPAHAEMDMYALKRQEMVNKQIKGRGVTDKNVLKAMNKVQRHLFVPWALRSAAYNDTPLPIGEEQTISQPYMVALMTEALELKGGEKVLEVGTGLGYQAAIIGALAKDVITVEKKENLAANARKIFKRLGYGNIRVVVGDGTCGHEKEAPYDAIIVTAGAPDVPAPLIEQLKEKSIS